MAKLVTALVACALLAACSSSNDVSVTTGSSAAPAPSTTNALAGTPMADYGHDLDKAKNVQDIVDQSAARQDAAINAATGSTSGNRRY